MVNSAVSGIFSKMEMLNNRLVFVYNREIQNNNAGSSSNTTYKMDIMSGLLTWDQVPISEFL